jgi:hypothetical protein
MPLCFLSEAGRDAVGEMKGQTGLAPFLVGRPPAAEAGLIEWMIYRHPSASLRAGSLSRALPGQNQGQEQRQRRPTEPALGLSDRSVRPTRAGSELNVEAVMDIRVWGRCGPRHLGLPPWTRG